MATTSQRGESEVEARFRLLVASLKDHAIIVLDPNGNITTWNACAQRITGHTADEVIGQHCSIFYTADDVVARKAEHELAVALRDGRYEEEGWRVRKDGTRYWANVTVTPLRNDDDVFIGYAKVTQDLSERRVAEEESRRFRLLVDSVKDYAIFILDPDGRITTWNAGAERLKGYTPQEILGRHFSTFYMQDDIDAGKCERELEGAARDGRFEDEGFRLRKDGSRFWANVVITALRDQAGALVGYAKVTRDLTDRLRVEQERTHALAMEEAARRKDEFLAVMGHELRNPLASIVTAAHLMKLRGRANEKEVDVVDRQARHMTRLVDDLLDASRALRDKVVLFPKKVEIGVVLANAIELASALFERRRHALTVDVPKGLVVQVDVERMGQVFGNILSNAAKYTPEGGRIHMSAEAQGDHVSVRIEDNGRGIAPELLAHVFDLFVQGEQGIERKEGGLGIGLAVARKFVEAHRGEIRAESAGTGRGTRFTVRLPFSRAASPDVAVEEQPAPPAKRHRILLVDDNHDSVDLMGTLLEHLGHEAHIAYDGPTGVQAFRELGPDIVFLDIGLPGLSGYEVLAQMRAMPAGKRAAIIAVSGYAGDVDRARALSAGFTDHLGKPVEMQRLEDLLADEHLHMDIADAKTAS